jgi:hypothetical protein
MGCMMKTCLTCGKTMHLRNFPKRGGQRGKQRKSHCRECFVEIGRRHLQAAFDRKAEAPRNDPPDPLNEAFRSWQGGEPRSDWRADMGLVCWPVEWQAVA